ncbi:MAG TPA: ATP synthase F1 subunit epsilon [Candidatus Megaira endosymbiont of Nemacystus decipiens]|nr:ATP synthase F1 subunit epsilon [Candidatus Megaera endosymbiont of Nemacystus decipiens]
MIYEDVFLVKILLPSEVLLNSEFAMVNLPGESGDLGVLKGHASLIANLVPGIIVTQKGSHQEKYYIHGGVAHIDNNSIVILSDFALDLGRFSMVDILDKIKIINQQLQACSRDDNNYQIILSKINQYKSVLEFLKK